MLCARRVSCKLKIERLEVLGAIKPKAPKQDVLIYLF